MRLRCEVEHHLWVAHIIDPRLVPDHIVLYICRRLPVLGIHPPPDDTGVQVHIAPDDICDPLTRSRHDVGRLQVPNDGGVDRIVITPAGSRIQAVKMHYIERTL